LSGSRFAAAGGDGFRRTRVRRNFSLSIEPSCFQRFKGEIVFRRPPRSAIIRLQNWDRKVRRTHGKGSEQAHSAGGGGARGAGKKQSWTLLGPKGTFRGTKQSRRWRGHLDKLLQKRAKLSRGHHAAMDYADVPAFIAELREREAMAALALEFCILTAARSGELYGARWPEIDFAKALWTIPAGRMKAAREHRVPLSSRALAILEKFSEARTGEFVFAGQRAGKPLSGMAMEMMLRRMKVEGVTVHGFRSAFRDWAGNETQFARELAESALAHVIGDKAEQAYRRGDALEKRRALMEAWANYCEPEPGSNVVKLARPRS
jgi:integrase